MGKRSIPPLPSRPLPDSASEDPATLFRDAVGPVRELPAVPLPPRRPQLRAGSRRAAHAYPDAPTPSDSSRKADALEAGDTLRYRRDSVAPRVLQQLGRGRYTVQDEIDLHWSDAAQAGVLLGRFLDDCLAMGLDCVRVVHGKGLHSDSRVPVLKNLVDRVLRQHAEVLAFHSAPPAQGGNGAVLILLKH